MITLGDMAPYYLNIYPIQSHINSSLLTSSTKGKNEDKRKWNAIRGDVANIL